MRAGAWLLLLAGARRSRRGEGRDSEFLVQSRKIGLRVMYRDMLCTVIMKFYELKDV